MSYVEQASLPVRMRTGASVAAREVDAWMAEALYQSRFSLVEPAKLLSSLYGLANEYGLHSTDVGRATVAQAVAFVAAMPSALPLPELSIDPDGEVALDWCRGDDMLSLSLNSLGRVSYAWNIDDEAQHDTETFEGTVMPAIINAIKQFA